MSEETQDSGRGVIVRISRDEMFMAYARTTAQRSTCERLHVGAIVTDLQRRSVVGIGYNGNARDLPNVCDRPDEAGNCGCVHAETNAVLNAGFGRGAILYTTEAPCERCAKLIINAGIRHVFYAELTRTGRDGIRVLGIAAVRVLQLPWEPR